MAAAPSASAALKTTPATDGASLGWTTFLGKYFKAGTFTDAIVRVHSEDEATGWWWSSWLPWQARRTIDVRCHSIILTNR